MNDYKYENQHGGNRYGVIQNTEGSYKVHEKNHQIL